MTAIRIRSRVGKSDQDLMGASYHHVSVCPFERTTLLLMLGVRPTVLEGMMSANGKGRTQSHAKTSHMIACAPRRSTLHMNKSNYDAEPNVVIYYVGSWLARFWEEIPGSRILFASGYVTYALLHAPAQLDNPTILVYSRLADDLRVLRGKKASGQV